MLRATEINEKNGETFGLFLHFGERGHGSIRNRRTLATLPGLRTDGLVIDAAGRLYVAAGPGEHVFSPQGQRLGTIPFPRSPQNMAFAGPDKKTLYVVGGGAVYAVAMQAEGPKGRAR